MQKNEAFGVLFVAFMAFASKAAAVSMLTCTGTQYESVQQTSIPCTLQLSVMFLNAKSSGNYACDDLLIKYRECSLLLEVR